MHPASKINYEQPTRKNLSRRR